MKSSSPAANGAEAFIESLNDLGVDRIFLNPGIDLVPLMAAIARRKAAEVKAPQIVLCTDESVAVAAAHGCAMVTGRPQVVTVFEDVGTLQGGGAIVNLKYGRIPVILCAGANSIPNRRNWLEETADQRRIVRDYVKWDYEVTAGENIAAVVREAYRVASAEPCGPVYLTFRGGVLAGEVGTKKASAPVSPDSSTPAEVASKALEEAARMLTEAENPLIMAAYSGRHEETVAELVALAEAVGSRAITTDLRMNFPSTHALCPGIDAIKGDSYDRYIAEADVVLLVDYNFPGPMAKMTGPAQEARLIHIDLEPLKAGGRLWNREPDIVVEGDSRRLLPRLHGAIKKLRKDGARDGLILARSERMAEEHQTLKEMWRERARSEAQRMPISTEWLCRCIDEAIDDDTIIVHMIPSNADALSHQIRRTKPGTMFCWGEHAGSMGWPMGAALGAKLAAPKKTVVSLVGDGGFIYGCPVATLWGSAAHRAPFLTVIFNNQSYAAMRGPMEMLYGADILTGDLGYEVGIDFRNPPDYAAVARACHAHGQTVDDPAEVQAALKTALECVRNGTSAVLDVKI
jgi:acetolactate synthase I/II/III large subunit